MKVTFDIASASDAPELAQLHRAVAERLTSDFGQGFWSSSPSERAILSDMRMPKLCRILAGRANGGTIVAVLRLATKKPWSIDTNYFTPVRRPLYLTGMAVHPDLQRKGIGRVILREAEAHARQWPADAIRLDAFDAPAGPGRFYLKCGYRELAHVVYKQDPLIYYELVL
ncbi:MAG TPA: GNAT family N-acetyltransferase [Terriglobales bacterium]